MWVVQFHIEPKISRTHFLPKHGDCKQPCYYCRAGGALVKCAAEFPCSPAAAVGLACVFWFSSFPSDRSGLGSNELWLEYTELLSYSVQLLLDTADDQYYYMLCCRSILQKCDWNKESISESLLPIVVPSVSTHVVMLLGRRYTIF